MNYILEINAFERWLEVNILSSTAQLLWYKLIYMFSRSGWQEWITIDNLRLVSSMGISEKTLISARKQLIENELIEFKKGKKGVPNKYKFISLYCKFSSTNDSTNDSTNYSINDSTNDSTNFSHNKNKSKQNNIEKESIKKKPNGTPTVFKPPTVEEVRAYCEERNNDVDAQRFVDFYTAKGWLVGKNKMKDWKACVRTWEAKDNAKRSNTANSNTTANQQPASEKQFNHNIGRVF